MSLFSQLTSWASKSTVIQSAEKQAIAAVSSAVENALQTAVSHAPDLQSTLETHAASLLQAAISGIATKAK